MPEGGRRVRRREGKGGKSSIKAMIEKSLVKLTPRKVQSRKARGQVFRKVMRVKVSKEGVTGKSLLGGAYRKRIRKRKGIVEDL